MTDEDYDFQNTEFLAAAGDALKSQERLETYKLALEGYSVPEIDEEVEVCRSTLHNYIQKFEQYDLLEQRDGRAPIITDRGYIVADNFQQMGYDLDEHKREMNSQKVEDFLEIVEDDEIPNEEIQEVLDDADIDIDISQL